MKTLTLLELAPDFFRKEDLIQFFQSEEFKNLNYNQLEHFVELIFKVKLDNSEVRSTIITSLVQIFGNRLIGLEKLILNHPSAYKTITKNGVVQKQILNKNIQNLLLKNIHHPLIQTLLSEKEVIFSNLSLNELGQKLGILLDCSKLSSNESLSNEDIQTLVKSLTSVQNDLNQKEKIFYILSSEVKKQVLYQMTFKQLEDFFNLSFFAKFVASNNGVNTLISLNNESKVFQKLMMKSHALIRKALREDFSYETIKNLCFIFGARRIESEIKSVLHDEQWLNLFKYENKTSNVLFLAYLLKHNVTKFKYLIQKRRLKIKEILLETKRIYYHHLAIEKVFKMAENGELQDYEMDSFLNYVLSSSFVNRYYSKLEKLMQENAERLLLSDKNNAILEATSPNYFNLLHYAIRHWEAQKLAKVLKSKTLDNQKIINVLRRMKFSDAYKMQVLKLL